eukprot:Lankesteria_metandrocarpae@DN1167_c0_g1_i1.p1
MGQSESSTKPTADVLPSFTKPESLLGRLAGSTAVSPSDPQWLELLNLEFPANYSSKSFDRLVSTMITSKLLAANEYTGNLGNLFRFVSKVLRAFSVLPKDASVPCPPQRLANLCELLRTIIRQLATYLNAPCILFHIEHAPATWPNILHASNSELIENTATGTSISSVTEKSDFASARDYYDSLAQSLPHSCIRILYRGLYFDAKVFGVRLSSVREVIAQWIAANFPHDLWVLTHCGFVFKELQGDIVTHGELPDMLRRTNFNRLLFLVLLDAPWPTRPSTTLGTDTHTSADQPTTAPLPPNTVTDLYRRNYDSNNKNTTGTHMDSTRNAESDSTIEEYFDITCLRQCSVLREFFIEICDFYVSSQKLYASDLHIIRTRRYLMETLLAAFAILSPTDFAESSLFLYQHPIKTCEPSVPTGANVTSGQQQGAEMFVQDSSTDTVHTRAHTCSDSPVDANKWGSGNLPKHNHLHGGDSADIQMIKSPLSSCKELHSAPHWFFHHQATQIFPNVFSPTEDYGTAPRALFLEMFIQTMNVITSRHQHQREKSAHLILMQQQPPCNVPASGDARIAVASHIADVNISTGNGTGAGAKSEMNTLSVVSLAQQRADAESTVCTPSLAEEFVTSLMGSICNANNLHFDKDLHEDEDSSVLLAHLLASLSTLCLLVFANPNKWEKSDLMNSFKITRRPPAALWTHSADAVPLPPRNNHTAKTHAPEYADYTPTNCLVRTFSNLYDPKYFYASQVKNGDSDALRQLVTERGLVYRGSSPNFEALLKSFASPRLDEHLRPVLLYIAVIKNAHFRLFCLSQTYPDEWIMPLLRVLSWIPVMCTFVVPDSTAGTGDSTGGVPTDKGQHYNTGSVISAQTNSAVPEESFEQLGFYPAPPAGILVLIVLTSLTLDKDFSRTLHQTMLSGATHDLSAYDSTGKLKNVSLGSLCILTLLRLVSWNFGHARDSYLHRLCAAVICNMSTSVEHLHWFVAEKLISYVTLLCRQLRKRVPNPLALDTVHELFPGLTDLQNHGTENYNPLSTGDTAYAGTVQTQKSRKPFLDVKSILDGKLSPRISVETAAGEKRGLPPHLSTQLEGIAVVLQSVLGLLSECLHPQRIEGNLTLAYTAVKSIDPPAVVAPLLEELNQHLVSTQTLFGYVNLFGDQLSYLHAQCKASYLEKAEQAQKNRDANLLAALKEEYHTTLRTLEHQLQPLYALQMAIVPSLEVASTIAIVASTLLPLMRQTLNLVKCLEFAVNEDATIEQNYGLLRKQSQLMLRVLQSTPQQLENMQLSATAKSGANNQSTSTATNGSSSTTATAIAATGGGSGNRAQSSAIVHSDTDSKVQFAGSSVLGTASSNTSGYGLISDLQESQMFEVIELCKLVKSDCEKARPSLSVQWSFLEHEPATYFLPLIWKTTYLLHPNRACWVKD